MTERNRGRTPRERKKSSIEDTEMAELSHERMSIHFIDANDVEADFDFGEFCVLLDKASISFSLAGDRTILLDQEVYNNLPKNINAYLTNLGESRVECGPVLITRRRRIQSREEAKKRALHAIGNRPIYRRN